MVQSPCSACSKNISPRLARIKCGECKQWFHVSCTDLDSIRLNYYMEEYNKKKADLWICTSCLPPDSIETSNNSDSNSNSFQTTIYTILDKLFTDFKNDFLSSFDNKIKLLHNKITAIETENKNLKHEIDCLKENNTVVNNSRTCETFIREIQDRDNRKQYMIIYGLPETQLTNANQSSTDTQVICNILNMLGIGNTNVNPVRLGKYDPSRLTNNRPVRVKLASESDLYVAFRNISNLKNSNDFKHLNISRDLTQMQRDLYNDTKKELQNRIAAGEDNLRITYVRGMPTITTSTRKPSEN